MTDIRNDKDTEKHQVTWPGGPREIQAPAQPMPDASVPPDYFAGSDLAENDPNWTGLWPNDTAERASTLFAQDQPPAPIVPEPGAHIPHSPASPFLGSEWPPTGDDPQLPPRAWPPDQFGSPQPAFVPESFVPESTDETARRSGLAYSAGIVFFVSVAFMLLLGWLVDLLLGSSPFGLVAGIVIGSAIGFIQFFYISKQIYEPSNKKSDIHTLMSGPDDEDNGAGL